MTVRKPPKIPTPDEAVFAREEWRQRLVDEYQPTAERLQRAYGTVIDALTPLADDLVNQLVQMVESGVVPDRTALYGMSEYQRLLVRTEFEMQRFGNIAQRQAAALQTTASQSGIASAQQLTGQIGGQIIAGAWVAPDPAAIAQLINYVDDPAMRAIFETFGENAAQTLADTIISGVAQGKGPKMIARMMATFINGVPLSWANNTTRTVQIYSYRYANHIAYQANRRVVTGWRWSSARDVRTCISCWSQEGRVFRLDQTLNDHHRGRCAPIPIVIGQPTYWRTGEEIFNDLPAAKQQQIMGPALYEAYQRGDAQFEDFSTPYQDSIYGEMLRRTTNREMGIR